MKKICIFLLCCACICASCLTKIDSNPLYQNDVAVKVCYVSKSEFDGAEVVRSGDLFFNYFDCLSENSDFEKQSIAVQFEVECELDELLDILDARIVSISEVEGMVVLCAWTKYGSSSFDVNGEEANIQIAVTDERIIVGFPAIYTSI